MLVTKTVYVISWYYCFNAFFLVTELTDYYWPAHGPVLLCSLSSVVVCNEYGKSLPFPLVCLL